MMYPGASMRLFKLDCVSPTGRNLNGVGSLERAAESSINEPNSRDHQGNALSLIHTRAQAQSARHQLL